MDGRKLVQHGPATLMVSLPAKWLKRNNLTKGDEINIEEKGNELLLKSDFKKKLKKKVEIKITSSIESSVRAILTNLYRLGYDEIIINFDNKDILKIIEKEARNILIGFEVIKRESNRCIIENILEPSQDQFPNIFSKFILNINEIFLIFENFLKGNYSDFEETEKQIQSFDNFCRRMIIKENSIDNSLRLNYHNSLYHGQRELYYALKILSKAKLKSNTIIELIKETKEIFEILKKSYDKKDFSLLEKIHKMEKELILEKGYDYLKKSRDPNEKLIIYRILSAIRNFYSATSPLMGLLILDESKSP